MSIRSDRLSALVLGASGFVGRRLAAHLHDAGWQVRTPDSAALNLLSPAGGAQLATLIDSGTTLFLAARARAADPVVNCEAEVAMAACVAKTLALARPARVVCFSTLSVYGDAVTNLRITEDTPTAPTSYYAVGKLAAEGIVRQAAAQHDVPCIVLRPCKMYGPGDPRHEYGPVRFVEQLLKDGRIELFGDGTERRDFVFIEDVARIAAAIAKSGHEGVFNVGTGTSHSFAEIVGLLRALVSTDIAVTARPRTRPAVDQRIDIGRLRRALPALCVTSLEDGLKQTYAHYAAQADKETAINA